MISLVLPALSAAQLAATIARADAGGGNAKLQYYGTDTPGGAGPHLDTLLATVTLAKPCATVTAGTLRWNYDAPGIVLATGKPRWCVLVAGDNAQLHIGDVTDMDHDGAYRVQGAVTEPSENTPTLIAGGTISPGTMSIE